MGKVLLKTAEEIEQERFEQFPDRIAAERESRLNTEIPVTIDGTDYQVPVTERSQALAPEAERRAKNSGSTRPFPTKQGTVEFDGSQLEEISQALDDYVSAVWRRQAELEALVADGTIAEADLTSGWPDTGTQT